MREPIQVPVEGRKRQITSLIPNCWLTIVQFPAMMRDKWSVDFSIGTLKGSE